MIKPRQINDIAGTLFMKIGKCTSFQTVNSARSFSASNTMNDSVTLNTCRSNMFITNFSIIFSIFTAEISEIMIDIRLLNRDNIFQIGVYR